jgi:Protein of unknown function (DUF4242)
MPFAQEAWDSQHAGQGTHGSLDPLGKARGFVSGFASRRQPSSRRMLQHTGRRALRDTEEASVKEVAMPKYVIERELPGAGKLTPQELKGISQKSCQVLRNLGPEIQWVQSFVTDDKLYCVYVAPNAEMIHEHAQRGGFPADRITEVRSVIDPTTGEL